METPREERDTGKEEERDRRIQGKVQESRGQGRGQTLTRTRCGRRRRRSRQTPALARSGKGPEGNIGPVCIQMQPGGTPRSARGNGDALLTQSAQSRPSSHPQGIVRADGLSRLADTQHHTPRAGCRQGAMQIALPAWRVADPQTISLAHGPHRAMNATWSPGGHLLRTEEPARACRLMASYREARSTRL